MNATDSDRNLTSQSGKGEPASMKPPRFTEAFRHDMAHASMSEAAVGEALGGLSQAAVNKWVKAGTPPPERFHPLRELFVARLGDRSQLGKLTAADIFEAAQVAKAQRAYARALAAQAPATGNVVVLGVNRSTEGLLCALLAAAASRTEPDSFGAAAVALLSSEGPEGWAPELRDAVEHARRLGVEVWHCADAVELAQRVAATPGTKYEITRR